MFCTLSLQFSAAAFVALYVDSRPVITRVRRVYELWMGDSQLAKTPEVILRPKTISKQEEVKRSPDLMTHQTVLIISEDTRLKTLQSLKKQPERTISIQKLKGMQKPREKLKQRKLALLEMTPPPKEHLLLKKYKNRKREKKKKKKKERSERSKKQKILRRSKSKKKKNLRRKKMKKKRKD